MPTRRTTFLAAAGATLAATSGCLGVLDSGETTETTTVPDVRIRNSTDGSRDVSLQLTRPLDWTPPGTTTRTSDGIGVAADRTVTVSGDDVCRLPSPFGAGGHAARGVVPPAHLRRLIEG